MHHVRTHVRTHPGTSGPPVGQSVDVAVTATVLLFVAVTGYLLLGRSPDPESQKSESSNPDGENGPEAGPAEAE